MRKEFVLDFKAGAAANLALDSATVFGLLRLRDLGMDRESRCRGTVSPAAGNCDTPVDAGAGLCPVPDAVFGAALDVPVAPRINA
jgi:hypothetical protein